VRVGFKVVGVPEAAGALNAMGEELGGQALEDATLAGAYYPENAWKDEVSYVTGQYKRSIHRKVTERTKGRVQVTIGTDIVDPPYPFVLEYGMTIRAKRAPYLHFKTKDGHWVKTKQVTIPAFGWARKAWDRTKDQCAREIEQALMAVVGKHWR
jgi:hypothetical protein